VRNHRWVRRWRQRRHRKKAERSKQGALREFVYLDEVSVYSLMASQVGLIVTELTETQATSLQSEVSSGLGLSAPLKAQVGSKIQAGENQSSQVLRKAIIQTTFKQLHDTATKSGALRLRVIEDDVPSVNTWDDVSRLAHDESASWVVNPSRLRRGDLVELDVRLEAEPIFQAEAMISGVLEIIQDDPAAFGVQDFGGLGQTRLVSRMLDKVLAGLVPVRGRATNYEVVEIDGEEWLLHTSLWSQLGQSPVPSRPVHLVGVAEQGQFWKDVRRVLFSDSSYRVLARLNRTGLQQSWTPVKLVDVLRNVVPDFAEVMDNMNRGVLSAMSTAVAAQQDTSPTHRVRAATVEYATLLGERAGVKINEDELEIAGLFDHQITDADINVRDWREMLARVTAFIEERTGLTFDRDVASDYRVAAITRAGLLEPAAAPVSAFETGPAEPPKERFLDAEIVAVYW
jgi:hypothetical protein